MRASLLLTVPPRDVSPARSDLKTLTQPTAPKMKTPGLRSSDLPASPRPMPRPTQCARPAAGAPATRDRSPHDDRRRSLHFTRACVRSREWAPRRYSCRVACVAVAPTPSLRRDAPAHEHHWQGGGVERGAAHWVRARERARGAAPCRPCCASSLGPRGSACARTELDERWTSRKSTVGCARCSRS